MSNATVRVNLGKVWDVHWFAPCFAIRISHHLRSEHRERGVCGQLDRLGDGQLPE
jgi:hypothetical protein